MRFIDEVTIEVHGGDGGRGCVAFRREAHVPRGGPSGGNGGDGGDVVLEADPQLTTLLDLRYQRQYRGERGQHGQGHDRHGRCGAARIVRVPCGTLVYESETRELLADLTDPGARFVAGAGGRGGRGNMCFVTSTNRAPRNADPGEPGQQRKLRLELKLLADVGLVGLPNAGKSTLISAVSAATPKIADYEFTTLIPHLGLVRLPSDRNFVMADIPGLIEGASAGAGLGHRFLRHVERTRLMLYVLDDRHALAGEAGSPLDDLRILQRELLAHDATLASRPALVVLNKVDLLDDARAEQLRRDLAASSEIAVLPISAATRTGLAELLNAIEGQLNALDTASDPA